MITDPPDVFFNYYSARHNHQNQSLAIFTNERDFPGQFPIPLSVSIYSIGKESILRPDSSEELDSDPQNFLQNQHQAQHTNTIHNKQ